MSKTVDERIVDMQFNNGQFESGIKQSTKSLENLKQGLKLDKSAKSLQNLGDTAKKFSLGGIADGVGTIASKFSAMGIVGVTALVNIANAAVNAGKRLVEALTIQPITDGFQEYEMTLMAVQTTMSGTGKTAKEVGKELKKLDDYADATIYSSADMFNNLPKFTNAGVQLEPAVKAMIGIANATALAGGDAGKASIAFYNLGQSIATGYLSRMDYNSINNAGIATMEWKNQMINAAIAAGTLKKVVKKGHEDMYKAGKKNFSLQALFIDGLQEQWATTDVMMKVFGDYGDTQTEIGKKAFAAAQDIKTFSMMMESLKASAGTGWKDTWQLIFGDLDEAKQLWTGLNNVIADMIGKANTARNNLLQGWKDGGGRNDLIQSFVNGFEALQTVLKPIREAFKEVFPPVTAQTLLTLTKRLKDFTAGLKMGDETAGKVKSAFKGFFSFLMLVGQALSAVAREVKKFLQWLAPAGEKILTFAGNIGDWLAKMEETVKKSDTFNKAFEKLNTVLGNLGTKAKEGLDKFKKAFEDFTGLDLTSFSTFVDTLKVKLETLQKIGDFLTRVGQAFGDFFKKVAPYFSKAGTFFGQLFGNMNLNTILAMVGTGGLAGIVVGLKNLIDSFKEISDKAGGFLDSIQEILDGVKESLEAYQKDIKANTLLKIAIAIGILAVSLLLLASIDTNKLASSMVALSGLFGELLGSMAIFEKIVNGPGFKAMGSVTLGLIGLSLSILLLSWAMTNLAKLDWEGIAKGLTGVGVLIAMLIGAAKLINGASGDLIKAGVAFMFLAAAVGMLALSVALLSALDPGKLAQGLIAVGVLMATLAGFTQIVGDGKGLITTAIGLMGLAVALLLLSAAVFALGSMQPEVIAQGMMSLILALGAITLALNLMPPNMVAIGVGFIAISAGLLLLANALTMMGGMSWDEIGRGLTVLAASLLILIVAMQFMTSALPGALSLLIIAGSLIVLAIAMQMLGNLSWEQLGKSLLAIVAILLIFAGAALLLGPVIPVIAALGIALLAMGVGLISVGLAALMLSIGLSALAVTGPAGIETLVAVAKALSPYILLAPGLMLLGAALLVVSVGTIAVGLAMSVLAGGLGLIAAVGPMGFMALQMLVNTGKQVADFAGGLLLAGAALLVFGAGAIVAGVGSLLAGIGIAVLGAGLMVLASVDLSNIQGISTLAGELLKASGILLLAAPGLTTGGGALLAFGVGASSTGEGLKSINSSLTEVVNALKNMPKDVTDAGNAVVAAVQIVIAGVTGAILLQKPLIVAVTSDVIDASVRVIDGKKTAYFTSGVNFVNGFIGGIRSRIQAAASEAAYMATSALDAAKRALDSHSPSKKAEKLGGDFDFGFAGGLKKYASVASKAASNVGESTLRPVQDMTNTFASGADVMGKGIQNMAQKALSMDPIVNAQKTVVLKHEFEPLQVQGVNNKKELVAVANYSVEDILMTAMRKQARVL